MNLRPTQSSLYSLVRTGLSSNTLRLTGFQEQIATGRRILRTSDDVVGATKALALRRQLDGVDRHRAAIATGQSRIAASTDALQRSTGILSEARALLIQGMNGTLNDGDRATIAVGIQQALEALFDAANAESDGQYVFSGTRVDAQSFVRTTVDGAERVVYGGNDDSQRVLIGATDDAVLNLSGAHIFGRAQFSGLAFDGLTGVALGSTVSSGQGDARLELRHDATTGAPGAGIALVGGGASDTILGDHTLVVDATAGTVQLDDGTPIVIGTPPPADLVVTDENGATLHLDFSAWTGTDTTATIRGEGSISLNGGAFTAIDFTETDLRLVDNERGQVVHVDTTGVRRAGPELGQFSGAIDVFSVLGGIVSDLENADGLSSSELTRRLELRLEELDRHSENVLSALGALGGTSARLANTEEERADTALDLEKRLSNIEDADFASIVLDLTRTQQTLELVQASGTRLLQTNLLRYLG